MILILRQLLVAGTIPQKSLVAMFTCWNYNKHNGLAGWETRPVRRFPR